ncbi:MAG: hypothetical protein CVU29_06565 [Betaproteobacteria bacterium HGW-Betaproteobacteria-22]|nr:MAG: hypothetical protein CVU29_06565 [Betaproteobacteria bacterium HGW-Betaproteobacteria-22]
MKKSWFCLLVLLSSQSVYAEGVWDALRELRGTVREVSGAAQEAQELSKAVGVGQNSSAQPQQSGGEPQAGDVIFSKITNLAIFKEANKKSSVLMRISKSDEMVYTGEEVNGFFRVATDKGEGWVDKILVKKN